MKNCKRILTVLLALLMVMSTLTACTGKQGATDNSSAAGNTGGSGEKKFATLNVGTQPVTVGFPLIYAKEQGWFEEVGLDVNVLIFPTGAPINEAIAADELDIACSGFASVYALANSDCSWLFDINTAGGMGLYARKDSDVVKAGNTLPDLPNVLGDAESIRGSQVLEPLGTSAQFLTECYLEHFGLTDADVEQVHMEYAPAYQAFAAGEGDLDSCSPPYSYTMDAEGYVKVASFEDATGVVLTDGCFARNEVVEKRAEEVQLFVEVMFRALDALQDEKVRYDFTMAKYAENAQDVSDEAMRNEIKDRQYCGTDYVKSEDYVFGACWGKITNFLVKIEKITAENAPNVAASFNTDFVEKAVGADIKVFQE